MTDSAPSSASPSLDTNAEQAQDHLASHLDALVAVRAYTNAVLQTNLTWNTDEGPEPAWFTTLKGNFATVKNHAGLWSAIEQDMVAHIPQALVDYGDIFLSATGDIVSTLESSDNMPSASQIDDIRQLIQAMLQELNTKKDLITASQARFVTFKGDAQVDFDTLTQGNNAIHQALNIEQDAIDRINGKIAETQAEIAKDQTAVTASAIAAGVGLVAGSAAMALGAETMGVGFLIGCFILIGAVAALATFAAYVVKLGNARTELRQEQDELASDQQMVVSLQLLQKTVTGLVAKNAAMADSLSAILDWYGTVVAKMQSLLDDVNEAKNQSDQNFWVLVKVEIETAQTAWHQLVDFATKYQQAAAGIQDKTADVTSDAA